MPIMDESLRQFQFKPEVSDFLTLLLDKARNNAAHHAEVDELYGLIPPLSVRWISEEDADANVKTAKMIRQWNLSGILCLASSWDDFSLNLLYSGNSFYACLLHCCRMEMWFEPETPLNLEAYKQIASHAERRLSLFCAAYGNTLLRLIGVRECLRNHLSSLRIKDSYPACLEILIRLINGGLKDEERYNLDLFCDRARVTIAECIGYRAGLSAKNGHAVTFLSSSAAHKSHLLFDEIYASVILVWGSLANGAYLKKERMEKGRWFFTENYFPDGRIKIGEILPALPGDKTAMRPQFGCDHYKQVFSDYETAAHFRIAALHLANQ